MKKTALRLTMTSAKILILAVVCVASAILGTLCSVSSSAFRDVKAGKASADLRIVVRGSGLQRKRFDRLVEDYFEDGARQYARGSGKEEDYRLFLERIRDFDLGTLSSEAETNLADLDAYKEFAESLGRNEAFHAGELLMAIRPESPLYTEGRKQFEKSSGDFLEVLTLKLEQLNLDKGSDLQKAAQLTAGAKEMLPKDKTVNKYYKDVRDQYEAYVNRQVPEMTSNYQVLEACDLLEEAARLYPDDSGFRSQLNKVSAKKPVTLTEIHPVNIANFTQVMGEPIKDTMGNSYSGENVYYTEMTLWNERTSVITVKLHGEYTHLHGTVAVAEGTDNIDGKFGIAILSEESREEGVEYFNSALSRANEPLVIDLDITGLDQICIYTGNNCGGFETANVILSGFAFYK